jgi:hypothetical protein
MLHDEASVALRLASLSAAEIVDAAAMRGAPRLVQDVVERFAIFPSRRLGKILARFDARIGERGVARAARGVLGAFGAALEVIGEPPRTSGALVVTNHPGAYDALATIAALGRDDVALVAAEREFVRAMPRLSQHIVFVTDSRTDGSARTRARAGNEASREAGSARTRARAGKEASREAGSARTRARAGKEASREAASATGRAAGLRRALAWLENGGVLVQFGAGAIEPDARFAKKGDALLGAWHPGTGVLASRAAALGAAVVPAFVSGVHSSRAKGLAIVRFAEGRGITTIAPLIQATMPGFRDVTVEVRFGAPVAREAIANASGNQGKTELVREAVRSLAPSSY